MKIRNKVILVVVILLVVLFGVGQFFTTSIVTPSGQEATNSSPTAPSETPTQVIAYAPDNVSTSTRVESGSCWTNSIAAPFRADAWRCTVGNSISDPCFSIPGSTSTLLCNVNPARPSATSTFALKLTKPLPLVEAPGVVPPANWAWLIELRDGTLCAPFTGTLPVTAGGEAASYGCGPGPLGPDEMIFGDLNASSSVWTATVGTIAISKVPTTSLPTIASSTQVKIDKVWQ